MSESFTVEIVEQPVVVSIVEGDPQVVTQTEQVQVVTVATQGPQGPTGGSVVHVATVGDGAATSFVVTHGFGTRDVVVFVYEAASPYAQVIPDVEMTTANTVTIVFASPPALNSYRVIVSL